mgnify:CR=1 FL=1
MSVTVSPTRISRGEAACIGAVTRPARLCGIGGNLHGDAHSTPDDETTMRALDVG